MRIVPFLHIIVLLCTVHCLSACCVYFPFIVPVNSVILYLYIELFMCFYSLCIVSLLSPYCPCVKIFTPGFILSLLFLCYIVSVFILSRCLYCLSVVPVLSLCLNCLSIVPVLYFVFILSMCLHCFYVVTVLSLYCPCVYIVSVLSLSLYCLCIYIVSVRPCVIFSMLSLYCSCVFIVSLLSLCCLCVYMVPVCPCVHNKVFNKVYI